MADGRTIGKLALAAATQVLISHFHRNRRLHTYFRRRGLASAIGPPSSGYSTSSAFGRPILIGNMTFVMPLHCKRR